jgi:hypothetical protein
MPNTLANWIYQINQQNKAELDETMKGVAQAVGSVIQANAEKARVMQDINSSNEISKLYNPDATPIGYDEQTGMATKDPNTNIQVNKIMGEYQSKLLTAQKDYPDAGVDWNKTNRLTIDSDIATAKANKTNKEFDLKSTTIGEAGQARYSELIGKGLPRSAAYDLASDTAKTEDKAQTLGSKYYDIFKADLIKHGDADIAYGNAKNKKDTDDANADSARIMSRQKTSSQPTADENKADNLGLNTILGSGVLYYNDSIATKGILDKKGNLAKQGTPKKVIRSLSVRYDKQRGWIDDITGDQIDFTNPALITKPLAGQLKDVKPYDKPKPEMLKKAESTKTTLKDNEIEISGKVYKHVKWTPPTTTPKPKN